MFSFCFKRHTGASRLSGVIVVAKIYIVKRKLSIRIFYLYLQAESWKSLNVLVIEPVVVICHDALCIWQGFFLVDILVKMRVCKSANTAKLKTRITW